MGTNDTFNCIMFKYFLHQMLQYLPNKLILVADNASIHKADEIQRFLLSSNLLLTTIPTYFSLVKSLRAFDIDNEGKD